jgi:hypothetical protein
VVCDEAAWLYSVLEQGYFCVIGWQCKVLLVAYSRTCTLALGSRMHTAAAFMQLLHPHPQHIQAAQQSAACHAFRDDEIDTMWHGRVSE